MIQETAPMDTDEEEEAASALWGNMDSDCLVAIFRRLPLDDVAAAAPLVCLSWRRAARDPSLWRALDLRRGGPSRFMPWSPLAVAFAARYAVRRFTFAGFLRLCVARARGSAVELALPPLLGAAPAPELDLVSLGCPMLRKVALPKLAAGDEAQLPEIIARWRRLEHLEIEHKPSSFVSTAAQIGASCPGFAGLKMAGSIKGEDAMAIASFLPRLKLLCLDNSYLPRQELLVIINGCPELEVLQARGCVGFDWQDEEVVRKAAMIKGFEVGRSRLVDKFERDDVDGDVDCCDSSYVDVI